MGLQIKARGLQIKTIGQQIKTREFHLKITGFQIKTTGIQVKPKNVLTSKCIWCFGGNAYSLYILLLSVYYINYALNPYSCLH